jgi:hypothetical protein
MKESTEPGITAFRGALPGFTGARGGPVVPGPSGIVCFILRAGSVLVSVLREIFDESAYARFLDRTKRASSREAYAAFCREGEVAKARRPRCC